MSQFGLSEAGIEMRKRLEGWASHETPPKPVSTESKSAEKFWNCDCGFQARTSAVYDEKVCPNCRKLMHDDTKELVHA